MHRTELLEVQLRQKLIEKFQESKGQLCCYAAQNDSGLRKALLSKRDEMDVNFYVR